LKGTNTLRTKSIRSRLPNRRRTATLTATAAVATAIATVGLASPAHAADGIIIKNVQTNRCLESLWTGATSSSNVCDGHASERWRITGSGSCVSYQNAASGWFLDSYDDGGGDPDPVATKPANGSIYQLWCYDQNAKSIRNVGTGKVLDNNNQGSVYSLTWNGTNYQRWDGIK